MAGSGFLLNPEDAAKAVSGFDDGAGKATATLRQLIGQADDLLNKYAGEQAKAFQGVIDEIKLRSNKLIEQVNQLSATVGDTAKEYGATDVDVAQSIRNSVYGTGSVYSKLTA